MASFKPAFDTNANCWELELDRPGFPLTRLGHHEKVWPQLDPDMNEKVLVNGATLIVISQNQGHHFSMFFYTPTGDDIE